MSDREPLAIGMVEGIDSNYGAPISSISVQRTRKIVLCNVHLDSRLETMRHLHNVNRHIS